MPALLTALVSLFIFFFAGEAFISGAWDASPFGNYWVVLAGSLLGLSHIAALLAASTHLYGCRVGYRRPFVLESRLAKWVSLETMLLAGGAAFAIGLGILLAVATYWSKHGFDAIRSVLPAVVGSTLMAIGAQNALGGFLLAVINGNEAKFLKQDIAPRADAAKPSEEFQQASRAIAS